MKSGSCVLRRWAGHGADRVAIRSLRFCEVAKYPGVIELRAGWREWIPLIRTHKDYEGRQRSRALARVEN